MIYTITIILSILVAINFMLLILSTNKVKKASETKNKVVDKPIVQKNNSPRKLTKVQTASQLSPTGS